MREPHRFGRQLVVPLIHIRMELMSGCHTGFGYEVNSTQVRGENCVQIDMSNFVSTCAVMCKKLRCKESELLVALKDEVLPFWD